MASRKNPVTTSPVQKKSGMVGSSCGLTVMLGGFQSARIDCWLSLPSTVPEFRKVHKTCEKFVFEKVREEVSKIHARNQEIKGSLSPIELFNKDVDNASKES